MPQGVFAINRLWQCSYLGMSTSGALLLCEIVAVVILSQRWGLFAIHILLTRFTFLSHFVNNLIAMGLITYRRFDLLSDEIRVLVLQPSEGNAPIRAHLTLTKLHNNLEYEALSYVWGDPGVTRPIYIRATDDINSPGTEFEVQITTNLESAFRHLRLIDRSRTLWADAICINQNDPDEKIHQIRNMDNIYRKASSVCMWLGEEANDSGAAMELIHLYHHNNPLEWKELPRVKDLSRHCKALTYLVCRPWFTRRWIVQEIMLARSV